MSQLNASSLGTIHLLLLLRHLFFFNDTATTEIYTLSLHDALPIYAGAMENAGAITFTETYVFRSKVTDAIKERRVVTILDRKSTRLNSSHANISYAVFCLKKKKKKSS